MVMVVMPVMMVKTRGGRLVMVFVVTCDALRSPQVTNDTLLKLPYVPKLPAVVTDKDVPGLSMPVAIHRHSLTPSCPSP